MKILHVTNRKGGVGKTTIALHAAWYFAEKRRVLFIDLDDQRNSSRVMQDYAMDLVTSDLLGGRVPIPGLQEPGIRSIGADAEVKKYMTDTTTGIPNLRNNLVAAAAGYDLCILDAGPSGSALNIGPLLFATHVISPIELATFSLEGVTALIKSVVGAKQQYNRGLTFLGLLPNKFTANQPDQKAVLAEILESIGQEYLFNGIVGLRQAYGRIGRTRQPVWMDTQTASRAAAQEIRGILATMEKQIWKGGVA